MEHFLFPAPNLDARGHTCDYAALPVHVSMNSRPAKTLSKARSFVPVLAAAGLLLITQTGCNPAKSVASQTRPQVATVLADWGDPDVMDRQSVIERTMRPYTGISHPGVDTRTLTGKIM